MADIEQVRKDLWRRIREHQKAGGSVRNEPMANRFGGDRGGFACGGGIYPLCLIGVVAATVRTSRYVATREVLDISADDVEALEAGFEEWGPDDLSLQPPLLLSPFYALGQEIAKKLTEEEAARAGA